MIKALLKSITLQLALKWQADKMKGRPSGLSLAMPRLNLPGDAPQGERFRLDCAKCGNPMAWDSELFKCEMCGVGMRTQDAALVFIEAGLEMLRAADRLESYDPRLDSQGDDATQRSASDGNQDGT
jgi:hypothetical protein